ncbi:CAMK protein kinase [Magnaporthiopsis poae ATCC 64411]|uniref:CAMK protein kinase n=1 Tax=Magnaporthiopsis poae (strain ATCC 64411 / 73-15) TaxID=644358 RepID=A0A0C4DPJ6_MAGP6|nr:CAMK protein kinase [Magnaporthiopsis poae ATCC 64411]
MEKSQANQGPGAAGPAGPGSGSSAPQVSSALTESTNSIPPDEFAQMLQERGIRASPFQHSPAPSPTTNPVTSSELPTRHLAETAPGAVAAGTAPPPHTAMEGEGFSQAPSGTTNPFTSSDLARRLTETAPGAAAIGTAPPLHTTIAGEGVSQAPSGTTNPFTRSDLARRLIDTAPMLAAGTTPFWHTAIKGERFSPAPSGTTNPFTSSELAHRLAETAPGAAAAAGIAPPLPHTAAEGEGRSDVLVQHHHPLRGGAHSGPDVRIILAATSKQAVTVQLDPLGYTDPGTGTADAAVFQRAILDAAAEPGGTALPGALSYQKLSVTQSKKHVGMAIQAKAYPNDASLLLHCELFFDPAADRIAIKNRDSGPVKVQLLAESGGEGVSDDGRPAAQRERLLARAFEIKAKTVQLLEAGQWEIRAASGLHVLDFTILPRRHIEITRGGPQQGTKRGHDGASQSQEEDEPSAQTKKGKLFQEADDDGNDTETVVFQRAPPHEPLTTARLLPASSSKTPTREIVPVPTLGHPMEELRAGDTARIIGHRGEDYTLSYERRIAFRAGCHVFAGQHSALPPGVDSAVAVVKVIRSPSKPVRTGTSAIVAGRLTHMAELWLAEVKNHLKVSQHASVVRLFDADARFLAMYMEHVNAPALDHSSYRASQNYCNLTPTDAGRVLSDMSSALRYIHSQGIVHNDIKPGNILYSPKSRDSRGAVLIDFGLSSEADDQHLSTGGTPWYVPPELLREEEHGGPARGTPGDVFALGVVMLFLVRKLPLPESCKDHPEWKIKEVLRGNDDASAAMETWLAVVESVSKKLDNSNMLEGLVERMVRKAVEKRIQVETLYEAAAKV